MQPFAINFSMGAAITKPYEIIVHLEQVKCIQSWYIDVSATFLLLLLKICLTGIVLLNTSMDKYNTNEILIQKYAKYFSLLCNIHSILLKGAFPSGNLQHVIYCKQKYPTSMLWVVRKNPKWTSGRSNILSFQLGVETYLQIYRKIYFQIAIGLKIS